MAYLLDSNVFIRAKNDYYGFDFCPAFWQWLEQAAGDDVAFSVEAVYDELIAGGDDLADWAKGHRSMFLPVTATDLSAIAAINRWANDSPDYDPSAKSDFASVADSFLVGQAVAGGHTIVTHERISDTRRRIKHPGALAKVTTLTLVAKVGPLDSCFDAVVASVVESSRAAVRGCPC